MSETDIAIEKAKAQIIKVVSEKQKKVAMAILQYVVLATPVDTGRARANWLVGINNVVSVPRDNDFDKNGGTTITEGISNILTSDEKNTTIYISNNLPYIGRLNDGHSKQTAVGFVQTSVELAKAIK